MYYVHSTYADSGDGGSGQVINFITVQRGGGSKKAKNLRTHYVLYNVHGSLWEIYLVRDKINIHYNINSNL